MYVCMLVTYSKGKDQPGKVSNPARGQLNREMNIFLSPFPPENLVARDGFSSPVPRQSAHLHTETAQSGPVILVVLCHSNRSSHGGICVVFFTSTDRVSTVPSNISGCQSGA